jgi:polysaccharide export outer membrane protein
MKRIATITAASLVLSAGASFGGQAKPGPAPVPTAAQQQTAAGIATPPDYVIGAGDVLTITYWDQKEMTGDYTVRPDGMVTLPLLNDVPAKGLTPEQLGKRLLDKSTIFEDPRITVGVRTINSRKVYITGGVGKSGPVDINVPMRVMELISIAGGLTEFTSGKNITILRYEDGKPRIFKFNYQEVVEGKKLEQNIELKPGDNVSVPE